MEKLNEYLRKYGTRMTAIAVREAMIQRENAELRQQVEDMLDELTDALTEEIKHRMETGEIRYA